MERIVCVGEGTTARCDDGMDNDGDGDTDCDDSDCMRENVEVCGGVADGCSNGMDDDGDGFTDCNDNDCLVADATCEEGEL
ncbi:MAG: hypothetical protein GWN79_05225, partial [Actinobacteria bacterium]|nr:hypothetical protein [Actinomycetota bacterium]NIT94869.1 hypothetical protein [Actinomycetota bacterium]NIU18522.1 hypothetical protein [Actinomycetota bacterium]NIU65368.1 hypothetical protein [Actinomycetota bacterium]NIV86360.1 hypothetical protein [Actinomycetota bacterium]